MQAHNFELPGDTVYRQNCNGYLISLTKCDSYLYIYAAFNPIYPLQSTCVNKI
jgi:hypothetical protein